MIDKCQVEIVDLQATYVRFSESKSAANLHGNELYIALTDLPLPSPPPSGAGGLLLTGAGCTAGDTDATTRNRIWCSSSKR
jgi:hypothetical protein